MTLQAPIENAIANFETPAFDRMPQNQIVIETWLYMNYRPDNLRADANAPTLFKRAI